MKINIFEGARRIALLGAGLATIGTLIAIVIHEPFVSASYSIEHPNGEFVRTYQSCPSDAAQHYFTSKTSSGKTVSINLCLLPLSFENGEQLVPYKIDEKNMVWGAKSYSNEVSAYEKELESRFRIPASDEDSITKEISQSYRENMLSSLGYLFAGLVLFGGFVWSIGWIIRGFLGIPRGMDKRPEA